MQRYIALSKYESTAGADASVEASYNVASKSKPGLVASYNVANSIAKNCKREMINNDCC